MRLSATILLSFACLLGWPGVAGAKIADAAFFEFEESATFTDCGFEILSEIVVSGRYWIRERRDGVFLGSERLTEREVLTNTMTGDWFEIQGHSILKELKAVHVEGTIYRFHVQIAGVPFLVKDSGGEVVRKDRGLVVLSALIETLGDDQPGGVILSQELVALRGPHESFGADDFCALATQLIGP